MCEIEGCDREVNRDSLCFKHKILTLHFEIDGLKRENRDLDVTGGLGNREYVKQMYENRRAAGLNDPEPENKKAAMFAPPIGVHGGKEHRARNEGL
jgi:hypothetical protein